MKIGICDDNFNDVRSIASLLERMYPNYATDMYTEPSSMLSEIEGGISYDLVFLDIIMPNLSGIELAKRIRELLPKADIIFITDSRDYAVEAFSVNVLHYLIKPITEESLRDCMNRYHEKNRNKHQEILVRTASGGELLININNINYCESDDHYINLYISNGTVVRSRMTQKELSDVLGENFLTISRGLIVSIDHIRQLNRKSCILNDGREILLSRKRSEDIHKTYAALVFARLENSV